MAQLKQLVLRDFRVFQHLDKVFVPGVNLILGGNGTGKTSILEAIYFAGRGKTFRHHQSRPAIKDGKESAIIVVQTEDPAGVIGIELNKTETRIRVDNRELKRRSELLHRFPIQLLTPQSHLLVESGPKARRIFLDFGLFHVEPSFHHLLTEFERVLRQRNAALSSGNGEYRAFDSQLIDRGERLASMRGKHAEQLSHVLAETLPVLLPEIEVDLRQRSGWQARRSLADALHLAAESDQRLGYTTIGPQRGSVEIWTKKGPAAQVLSRGQQKILVLSLVLAQATIMHRATGSYPILLIDDLSAELDRSNRSRVLEYLAATCPQVFVTNTEEEHAWAGYLAERFHVEHSRSI